MDKVKRIIVLAVLLALVALSAFSASKKEETILLSYFSVVSEEDHGDYYAVEYSFKDSTSTLLFSDTGIEIPETPYLSSSTIASIMSESWFIDYKGYGKDLQTTAKTVTAAIKRYLDGMYPVTEVTAEKASSDSKETLTVSLAPFQKYQVTYFNLQHGLVGSEVDYFESIYSFGTEVTYINRFVDDFGIGMSVGMNLTFEHDEVFGNFSTMFNLSGVVYRLGKLELLTTMGYGGFVTINENSVSFVPGMTARVGVSYTADESMTFVLSAGLDMGLWLWRTDAAHGFVMLMQKPVSFGVGIRI